MRKNQTAYFIIMDLQVEVSSIDPGVLDLVRHDFSFFEVPTSQKNHLDQFLVIQHTADAPLQPIDESPLNYVSTPRNITYRMKDYVYVDYFGRGSLTYSDQQGPFKVSTADVNLAREIIFLTILSRVSEQLDKRGYHRVHALGLSYKGNGVLLLLPSGGGKTTMALNILTSKLKATSDYRLISEDSPLLDRKGYLHPFPVRIGVLPDRLPRSVPKDRVKLLKRMEFSDKYTIDILHFKKRLCERKVPLKLVLLGSRTFQISPRFEKASHWSTAKAFLSNSVIGIGLYQGLEFLTQSSPTEAISIARNVGSRALASGLAVSRAPTFKFFAGPNPDLNFKSLDGFLRGHFEKPLQKKTYLSPKSNSAAL